MAIYLSALVVKINFIGLRVLAKKIHNGVLGNADTLKVLNILIPCRNILV